MSLGHIYLGRINVNSDRVLTLGFGLINGGLVYINATIYNAHP